MTHRLLEVAITTEREIRRFMDHLKVRLEAVTVNRIPAARRDHTGGHMGMPSIGQ
jgi:hypothetical protein